MSPSTTSRPDGSFSRPRRGDLIRLAIAEAGLEDRVDVAYWPDIYAEKGFQGVIARIKALNPGQVIHGIHGSDWGGMTVRSIMDECGWIYPIPTLRSDGVSATAIRAGAKGMTSAAVSRALERLAMGLPPVVANDAAEIDAQAQETKGVQHVAAG